VLLGGAVTVLAFAGRPLEAGGRVLTPIEYEDRLIGALVHDASLLEDPALLEAAVGVARIGMEKDRLQAELRARVLELERERDFVQTAIDSTPFLFCTLDPQGHVRRINRTVGRLSWKPGDPDVHERYLWDVFIPEEDHEVAKRAVALAREGLFGVEHETGWLAADGSHHIVAWTLTSIVNAQGLPRFLLTGMDVTDRKREEIRTRALLDAIPDNMFRISSDGVYLDFHAHDPHHLFDPERLVGL
jgi:PAS domain S-box-containing protein